MSNNTADRLTGQLMLLPDIIGNLGLNIAAAQDRLDDNYLTGIARLIQMLRATIGRTEVEAAKVALAGAESGRASAEKAHDEADAAGKAAAKTVLEEAQTAAAAARQDHDEAETRAAEARVAGKPAPKVGGAFTAALEALLLSLAPTRYRYTETTLDFSADLSETKDINFQLGIGVGLQAVMINAAYAEGFGYDYRAAARITTRMHAISPNERMTRALLDRAETLDSSSLNLPERTEVEQRVWDRVGEIYKSLTGKDAGADSQDAAREG